MDTKTTPCARLPAAGSRRQVLTLETRRQAAAPRGPASCCRSDLCRPAPSCPGLPAATCAPCTFSRKRGGEKACGLYFIFKALFLSFLPLRKLSVMSKTKTEQPLKHYEANIPQEIGFFGLTKITDTNMGEHFLLQDFFCVFNSFLFSDTRLRPS